MYPSVFVPPPEPPLFVFNTKHGDGLVSRAADLASLILQKIVRHRIAGQFWGRFTEVALLHFATTVVSMYERSLMVLIDIKCGSIVSMYERSLIGPLSYPVRRYMLLA